MIPTRDANFERWQVTVATQFNALEQGIPSGIRNGSVGILPVSDGAIPPGLITDASGNLIWVEVYHP